MRTVQLQAPSTAREDCGFVAFLVTCDSQQRVLRTEHDRPEIMDDDPEDASTAWIGFYFRGLTGKDQRALGNATSAKDRKGREANLYGDVMFETCRRAVVEIVNLVDRKEQPVKGMTEEAYNLLKSPVTDGLYLAIKRREEAGEEELGE